MTRFDARDAAGVSALIARAKRAATSDNWAANDTVTPARLVEASSTGLVLVARNGGPLVGTGTLIGHWIHNVFVEPGFWRCGIGNRIMEALEGHARHGGALMVGLFSSLTAVAFYEERRFRRHHATIIYGQEVVEMYKDLSPGSDGD